MMKARRILFALSGALMGMFARPVLGQESPIPGVSAVVDDQGILRWTANGAEVALFGVNYTTPFAHAFRAHRRLGIDWKQAIDADVYHFARLGLDAYRVHVWDREISDAAGNLLVNEHVEAFDYLLAKLKERGIKSIITPLQFGDAGYPEPGVPLPGFSSRYGKAGCLEDRNSWPLQVRYLTQFVRHVNPNTGLAYKDDPDIIAFEICNEPGHWDYQDAVDYINTMAGALRAAGCGKPIFYNMSHHLQVHDAYLDADVQGGTFQWYPENLLAGHEQRGNFLPYVDTYPIPFAADPRFRARAKMVYEFDAADIGRAYLYPAMARAFRTAGMQFATQFAYDPMFLAPFNTEYQTHYMNLAYAPRKALGLMIAGEAFRRVPRGRSYGPYPQNMRFAGVRVSYREDLAELVADDRFLYSNNTASRPPHPERLESIAGCGSSALVSYPGRGAYFLDRLEPGVWRLEVMPDPIWVRDPFEKASPHKRVARIVWAEWPMSIRLPDLGGNFRASGLDPGNAFEGRAREGTLAIRPGAYLLTRAGVETARKAADRWRNITLGEFVAPPASLERIYVLHHPVRSVAAGSSLEIPAVIAGPEPLDEVRLYYLPAETYASTGEPLPVPGQRSQPGGGNQPGTGGGEGRGIPWLPMKNDSGYDYRAEIPADRSAAGIVRYYIAVRRGDAWTTFPSEVPGLPTDWDFYGEPWSVRVVPAGAPVLLFEAAADAGKITAQRRGVRYDLVPADRPGSVAMKMLADDLSRPEHDHSFRYYFRDQQEARAADLAGAKRLVLYGRAEGEAPVRLQLALVSAGGIAHGGLVEVKPEFGAYSVGIDDLRQVRSPNIPHGYPVFIPFWSETPVSLPLDLREVESVMVSIGPGMSPDELTQTPSVLIERIWLE